MIELENNIFNFEALSMIDGEYKVTGEKNNTIYFNICQPV